MASPRTLKRAVWLLTVAFLLTAIGAAYLGYQNFVWKLEAIRYAESSARLEAHSNFRKGLLLLYKIDGQCDQDRFSGNREGPFEIWLKFYQPSLGAAHRISTERWVEAFNDQMRRMQKDPEKAKKRLGIDQ
jgi:hypothetical protein